MAYLLVELFINCKIGVGMSIWWQDNLVLPEKYLLKTKFRKSDPYEIKFWLKEKQSSENL